MSTVRIQGYSTYQVEQNIYKLFASDMLSKFDATRLLNKCSRIFDNAVDQLEEVTKELNLIREEVIAKLSISIKNILSKLYHGQNTANAQLKDGYQK